MVTGQEQAEQASVTMTRAVPMGDGVKLATDVYLPAHAGPCPAVLSRIPYDRGGPLCFLSAIADRFLKRGWAFIGQDVRGKFASAGDRAPFATEAEDGADTLDWIVAQPWSDGRVVMIGDSYCGYTQLAAASTGHHALKAITPRVTSAEVMQDWLFHHGVPCLSTAAGWTMFAWSQADLAEGSWDFAVTPYDRLAECNLGHDLPILRDWYGSAAQQAPVLSPWTVPTLHLAGWWDVFLRGQFRTWERQRAEKPESVFLHVAAVDHQWSEVERDGGVALGRTASGAPTSAFIDRYLTPIMRFFDYVLDGGPPPPPIEIDIVGDGTITPTEWPPAEATAVEFFLVDGARGVHGPEGGGLSLLADTTVSTVSWTHDPADPVPDLIADPWSLAPRLPDERDVEVRDDVATFTGAALAHPMLLAGPVEVELHVSSDAPSAHVVAKLVDVDPLGRASRICAAIVPVAEPFPARAALQLGPVAYLVEAGHHLRLEVASSMFPRYAVHPGTDAPLWTTSHRQPSGQVLQLGPDLSRLRVWTCEPDRALDPNRPINQHL